ncbi:MAG TPA: DUF1003 domain-containing protein [Steroidobacteraceae bacterium]|nr:DUF1003 domain-containing protein [Steroidobacteraceae bacterium]
MHVWQWLITGLVAGLIARLVLRGGSTSLGADLALGSLGGLASGALMRYAGLTTPASDLAHVAAALVGAVGMIAAMHLALRTSGSAGRAIGAAIKRPDLAAALAALGERERRVVSKFLKREPVARDVTIEQRERMTLGQRAADRIAAFGGSWAFMGLFAAVLLAWMLYNSENAKPFDPFPFILLNLVLSCLAAAQAPVILMSQNRQAEKDRINARLDYEVNLKAELEIIALHEKLDELRDRAWRHLLAMQERQLVLLEQLERNTASR